MQQKKAISLIWCCDNTFSSGSSNTSGSSNSNGNSSSSNSSGSSNGNSGSSRGSGGSSNSGSTPQGCSSVLQGNLSELYALAVFQLSCAGSVQLEHVLHVADRN